MISLSIHTDFHGRLYLTKDQNSPSVQISKMVSEPSRKIILIIA